MAEHASIDRSNLAQVIRDFPTQFAEGLRLAAATPVAARGITRAVVAGVGGSALPANVLADYLAPELPVLISRDYTLEPKPDAKTLLFVNSFSGTTEETIASFEEGMRQRAPMVALSHGGMLEELAKESRVPHIHLPPVIQPRYATGLFFAAMAGVLEQVGAIIGRSREIEDLGTWLGSLDLEATGKAIAEEIGTEAVPFVYSSTRLRAVPHIWKIKINENAKTQCFWNVFPEMNHNEMVGFSTLRMKPVFVLLRSDDDHPRTQKRMEIFGGLMRDRGLTVVDVPVPPGPYLFQAFATLLLGDWVSYYMAINSGVDPTPVDMVEEFKKLMARP